jgi:hypothetical protein
MIHQFFLTPDSLYVLVADDRSQRTDFDYWFDVIDLLGGQSPVLVVLNERNYKSITNFDHNTYKKRYGRFAIERRDVDLAHNDARLESLREQIHRMLSDLVHVGSKLPAQWILIREELQKLKSKNHITIKEYIEICSQYGITEEINELLIKKFCTT